MASPGSESKRTFVSSLKEVTFFVAVYLYFAGFVYIYYYYDHFGIPLRVVDTPVYYYFVYSYNITWNLGAVRWADLLTRQSTWVSLIIILAFSTTLMVVRRDKRKSILLLACLTALFPLLSSLAFETANIEAKRLRLGETAKEITFVFKEDSRLPSPVRAARDAAGAKEQQAGGAGGGGDAVPPQGDSAEYESLRLLLDSNKRVAMETVGETTEFPKLYLITETTQAYYVLHQARIEGEAYEGYVFEVPKSAVLFTAVQIPEPRR